MGIEPTLFAWEARVLPLNDTRDGRDSSANASGKDQAFIRRRVMAPIASMPAASMPKPEASGTAETSGLFDRPKRSEGLMSTPSEPKFK